MPLILLKCSCGHFEVFTRHRKIPGLRKEIYVAIELMEVPVTYDGKMADEHKIDLYALGGELLSNVVYGVGQAAFLSDSSSTWTPSLNFTLFTTNVSSTNPLSRFHFFCAASSSL